MGEKVKKFGQHCSTRRKHYQPLLNYLYNSIEDILSAKTSNLELRKSEKVRSTLFDTSKSVKSVPPSFCLFIQLNRRYFVRQNIQPGMGEKVKKFGQHCSTLWNQYLPLLSYLYNSIEDIASAKTSNLAWVKYCKSSVNTVRHCKISTARFLIIYTTQ